jgi:hypothetical protein
MAQRSNPTGSSDESDHYEHLSNVHRGRSQNQSGASQESSNWIMRPPERHLPTTSTVHSASSVISSELLDRPPDALLRRRRDELVNKTDLSADFHTDNEVPPFEDYDEDPLVNLRTGKIAEEHDGYLVRKSDLEPRGKT